MNLDFMSDIIKLESEQHFQDILAANESVLLAISEEWCSECRVMEGTLINAAFELKGKAVVVKSDVAISQELSRTLGIRTIPVYVAFKKGEAVEILPGRQPIQALTKAFLA